MFDLWNKVSILVSLGLTVALGYTVLQLESAKKSVEICQQERKIDHLEYENAQKAAEALSLQQSLEAERKAREEAHKADEAYSTLLNKYNASIVRYQAEAANRSTGSFNLSSSSSTTDGSYTTSENTSISITLEDAGICAENTARLQAVREWATSLQ